MTKDEKVRAIAIAFMADDPEEYQGETVEQVIEQIKDLSDEFLDNAYNWFVIGDNLH